MTQGRSRAARLLLATTIAAALLVAPALADAPISGTYTAKVRSGANAGTWSLTMSPSGVYTVKRNGTVGVSGRATFSSGQVHFKDSGGPLSCGPTGTYRYTKTSSTVRFTKVSDPCAGRATVLTIGTFKK